MENTGHRTFYEGRYCKEYLQQVLWDLDHIEDEATEPSERRKELGRKKGLDLRKQIEIDFAGIAASTLLAPNFSGRIIPGTESEVLASRIAAKFESIMLDWKRLNDDGYCLKFRFLFPYPHSPFLLNLIEAETQGASGDIFESDYYEFSLNHSLGVGDAEFKQSNIIKAQIESLRRIQSLVRDSHSGFSITSPMEAINTIQVRFSCIGLSFCMLRVNRQLYCDPYLFAKKQGEKAQLHLVFPLVRLRNEHPEWQKTAWRSVRNDFYYVWSHETTLLCRDATKFKPDQLATNLLHVVHKPDEVEFEHKEQRLSEAFEFKHGHAPAQDILREWNALMKHKFLDRSKVTKDVPLQDHIFISCSWDKVLAGFGSPNEFATAIEAWVNADFGRSIGLKIVRIYGSEAIMKEVYEEMDRCTLGIVFLTRDIADPIADMRPKRGAVMEDEQERLRNVYYARPNIYHELGYLIKHLDARRSGRLLIFRQKGVFVPSNSFDMGRYEVNMPRMKERLYVLLLLHLKRYGQFTPMTRIERAAKAHQARLQNQIDAQTTDLHRLEMDLEQSKRDQNKGMATTLRSQVAGLRDSISYMKELRIFIEQELCGGQSSRHTVN